MKRYLLSSLLILFSVAAGYHIVRLWWGVIIAQEAYTAERLLQAARIDPSNPDPFHKLGLLYQWDLLRLDLNESERYFKKAVEKNPLEQEYWLSLARIYGKRGQRNAVRHAIANTILVHPTSYRGRWVVGNLLLQHGSLEKALPHFSYILSHYPNQSSLVYEIWGRAVDDPGFILERLIPRDPSSLKQYLLYLYETGDKKSARQAWEQLASIGYEADRRETIRHIEFLISSGDLTEANSVWKERLRLEGLPVPSNQNPITNGGFEKESSLGGGFDWRIQPVAGAKVSFDHLVSFEGTSSLKIAFDGEENLDFHHVYQYLALEPDTDYVLTARVKTASLTTKSGVGLEVFGIGPAFSGTSEFLTGDNGWSELAVSFRTPSGSRGAMVRVRRYKTDKFDRFIAGTVWLDSVQIRKLND